MTTQRTPPSDATLVAAARADPDAFRSLYDRYAERIYGYFLRRTRNHSGAQDLTAETFAQAWFSREKFADHGAEGSAAPWLFGIARNVLLMSLRRGALEQRAGERLGLRERLDAPGASDDVVPEAWWAEGADELLNTLPESQRSAISLRVLHDLAYDEIAEQLHISESAARVRVHRGLKALRARVSEPKDLR